MKPRGLAKSSTTPVWRISVPPIRSCCNSPVGRWATWEPGSMKLRCAARPNTRHRSLPGMRRRTRTAGATPAPPVRRRLIWRRSRCRSTCPPSRHPSRRAAARGRPSRCCPNSSFPSISTCPSIRHRAPAPCRCRWAKRSLSSRARGRCSTPSIRARLKRFHCRKRLKIRWQILRST